MIINNEIKINLFYQMLRIRMIEEAIAENYSKQKMRTPVHLSIGQEAAAAASGAVLRKTDYAVGSHRAHAHYFAKGGNLNAMIAELHGKVTGCCRGRNVRDNDRYKFLQNQARFQRELYQSFFVMIRNKLKHHNHFQPGLF